MQCVDLGGRRIIKKSSLKTITGYENDRGDGRFPFFFQAEDGIRDVERSRGLGDVYKRQNRDITLPMLVSLISGAINSRALDSIPVSYTHLTLPTICSV